MTTRLPAKKTPAAKKNVATKKPVAVKQAAAPGAAPAPAPALPEIKHKAKEKLVRDSFTMPRSDFDLIALLKERALTFKRPTKKSELLRAGLRALAALNQKQLQTALDSLPLLKSGRPKKLPPAAKAVGVE
ncbi:MAG: hypothetical protein ABI887_06555 [Burkholderiales bacterium]